MSGTFKCYLIILICLNITPSINTLFLIMLSGPDDIFWFQKWYVSDIFPGFFIFEWQFLKLEVQLTYNTVLVSGIQNSDSVFLQIIFYYRLLQDNLYNSLCYTVYSCCSSLLHVVVSIYKSQATNLSLPFSLSFGNQKFVFCVCESVFVHSFVLFFRRCI